MVLGLLATGQVPELHLVAGRRNRLFELPVWAGTAVGDGPATELVDAAVRRCEDDAIDDAGIVVIVDDVTDLVETEADWRLADLVKLGRDRPVRVVVAGESQAVRRSMFSGVLAELRRRSRVSSSSPTSTSTATSSASGCRAGTGAGSPPVVASSSDVARSSSCRSPTSPPV